MMTVRVLEHNGFYTAYRLVVKRLGDGTLRESVKQIDIPLPPPNGAWREWAARLKSDELEVGLQVFFDRWNFGSGNDADHVIYQMLCDERAIRAEAKHTEVDKIITAVHSARQPPRKPPQIEEPPTVEQIDES